MRSPLPHAIRVRGRGFMVVVTVLLAVLLASPERSAGTVGPPVGPVPVGVWPLVPQPPVMRAFDPPDDPWGAGHRGVDLAGRVGQAVRAALGGTVGYVGTIAGRGIVVVDHGPTRTTYQPVAATVRVGDPVAQGAPIGTLLLRGSHCLTAACLHWGWIRGHTYLDPLLLVGGGPVVLLPLWRGAPVQRLPSPVPTPPFAAEAARLLARAGARPDPGRRPASPPSRPGGPVIRTSAAGPRAMGPLLR